MDVLNELSFTFVRSTLQKCCTLMRIIFRKVDFGVKRVKILTCHVLTISKAIKSEENE